MRNFHHVILPSVIVMMTVACDAAPPDGVAADPPSWATPGEPCLPSGYEALFAISSSQMRNEWLSGAVLQDWGPNGDALVEVSFDGWFADESEEVLTALVTSASGDQEAVVLQRRETAVLSLDTESFGWSTLGKIPTLQQLRVASWGYAGMGSSSDDRLLPRELSSSLGGVAVALDFDGVPLQVLGPMESYRLPAYGDGFAVKTMLSPRVVDADDETPRDDLVGRLVKFGPPTEQPQLIGPEIDLIANIADESFGNGRVAGFIYGWSPGDPYSELASSCSDEPGNVYYWSLQLYADEAPSWGVCAGRVEVEGREGGFTVVVYPTHEPSESGSVLLVYLADDLRELKRFAIDAARTGGTRARAWDWVSDGSTTSLVMDTVDEELAALVVDLEDEEPEVQDVLACRSDRCAGLREVKARGLAQDADGGQLLTLGLIYDSEDMECSFHGALVGQEESGLRIELVVYRRAPM